MDLKGRFLALAGASAALALFGFALIPKWVGFLVGITANNLLPLYLFLLFLSILARDAEPGIFTFMVRLGLVAFGLPLLPAAFLGSMAYNAYLSLKEQNAAPAQTAAPDDSIPQPNVAVNRKRNPHAFDSLVGVDHAVAAIKDALELPLLYPDLAQKYNIKPPRGILLYGPPGTGKTSLARATAEYFACYFINVKASELAGPYVGTTEKAVKDVFAQARANRPAIIFFDEIDAIARKRDGSHMNRPSDLMLNLLLAEMDGFSKEENEGIFVMAATNRPDVLDEALLRPGRFDSLIETPLPDFEARKKLFQLYLRNRPLADDDPIDLNVLAEITEGMSPAEIEAACRKAAMIALKREAAGHGRGIRMSDLLSAINKG